MNVDTGLSWEKIPGILCYWNMHFLPCKYIEKIWWQCYNWDVHEFFFKIKMRVVVHCVDIFYNQWMVHLQFHSPAQIGESFHGTIFSNPSIYWEWIHKINPFKGYQIFIFQVIASFDEFTVSTIFILVNIHNLSWIFANPIPHIIFIFKYLNNDTISHWKLPLY